MARFEKPKACSYLNVRPKSEDYGQPWHTGIRVAKYPKDKLPVFNESLSTKKPWLESMR